MNSGRIFRINVLHLGQQPTMNLHNLHNENKYTFYGGKSYVIGGEMYSIEDLSQNDQYHCPPVQPSTVL